MKKAKLISTTQQTPMEQTDIFSGEFVSEHELSLNGDSFQTIDGFGGCFNELGYRALNKLSKEKQEEVLKNIFSPSESNFTYCRLPIGASDYAESWYSLNETEGDYAMEHFTIERDKGCLIPYIKAAEKHSGGLTLFASPWSPPVWMKYPKAYNFGTLIWTEENLNAYALYFKKFVEAYAEEGLTLHQIHIQNEPIADQKFPSCVWSGEHMRDFIKDYLGPLFQKSGLNTEIWLGTINAPYDNYGHQPAWHTTNYNHMANIVLSDPKAKSYISGVGYQWGGKNAIQQTHIAHPDMKLAQTENECGDGKNSWDYAEYVFCLMWHFFINGVSSYTYWNMILEEGGVSTWGWYQNSMVTVTQDGQIQYNPEYYLMRHFSQYIKKGAVLLGLAGDFAGNALAFQNTDGSIVIEILNPFDFETQTTFSLKGEHYTVSLKAHSFNTFILE